MNKKDVNVAIIGLTRRTAAIGQALRDNTGKQNSHLNFILSAFDESPERERQAKEIGAIDSTGRMNTIARQAHIVLVDQTPGNLEFAYDIFGPELKAGTVVLDFSPIQRYVQELAARYFPKDEQGKLSAYLIGAAPLVNMDALYDTRTDIASADPGIYRGSDMVIATPANCPAEAVKLAADLAEIVGMKPHFMEPAEYDGLIDFTENMPMVMSTALFAALERSKARLEIERIINTSFALAAAPLREMKAKDIVALWQHSRDNSILHIDELLETLGEMRRVLAAGDEAVLNDLAGDLLLAFGLWEERRTTGTHAGSLKPEVPQGGGLFKSLLGFGYLEERLEQASKKNQKKR